MNDFNILFFELVLALKYCLEIGITDSNIKLFKFDCRSIHVSITLFIHYMLL